MRGLWGPDDLLLPAPGVNLARCRTLTAEAWKHTEEKTEDVGRALIQGYRGCRAILAKLSQKFRGSGFEGSRFTLQGDAQRDEMEAPKRGHSVLRWRKTRPFCTTLEKAGILGRFPMDVSP